MPFVQKNYIIREFHAKRIKFYAISIKTGFQMERVITQDGYCQQQVYTQTQTHLTSSSATVTIQLAIHPSSCLGTVT